MRDAKVDVPLLIARITGKKVPEKKVKGTADYDFLVPVKEWNWAATEWPYAATPKDLAELLRDSFRKAYWADEAEEVLKHGDVEDEDPWGKTSPEWEDNAEVVFRIEHTFQMKRKPFGKMKEFK